MPLFYRRSAIKSTEGFQLRWIFSFDNHDLELLKVIEQLV